MIRRLGLALLFAWPALAPAAPPRPVARPSIAGIVTDPALGELSGLAPSRSARDRYWAINDGGNGNHLLLVDGRGRVLRKLSVDGVENTDWEDLASFRWQGKNWLLIADTGDNAGERESVVLWLLPEPAHASSSTSAGPASALRLRYPDEPHDVEAMTVDADDGAVYLLTKRTVPPVLYRVPLAAAGQSATVTAERVGTLDAIPQPSAERHCARRSTQPLPLADNRAGTRLQSARLAGSDLRRHLSLCARSATIVGSRAPGAEACAVVAQPFAASRSHGLRSGLSQSFCRQRKGPRTPASIPLPTAWRSGGGSLWRALTGGK